MFEVKDVRQSNVEFVVEQFRSIKGKGNVFFSNDGEVKKICDVLQVPSVTKNLLSIGSITNQGCLVLFKPNQCQDVSANDPSKIIARGLGDPTDKMYKLEILRSA